MSKNKNLLFVIIIVLTNLIVLTYFGFNKKGMHFDEFFSYFNTNNSYGRIIGDREFLNRNDIIKDFYVLNGEDFNYKNVVRLQSYDVHPPVFYILLHTVCSFTPMIFSYWQGLSLNILYLIIVSVLLFFILNRLTKNNKFSFAVALLISINSGFISNAMFIRMYALMTLFIVLSLYFHVRMAEYDDLNFPVKLLIMNSIVVLLGFLTHYFYLLYLFFLEVCFFVPRIKLNKTTIYRIVRYGLSVLFAGILGVLLYPACLGHVNSGYRGTEVKSYLFDISDFGVRFKFFGNLLNKHVFNGAIYFYLILIVILLVTVYWKKNKSVSKKNKNIGIFVETLLMPTLFYYLVSVKGSLMGDEDMMRYQLPIYGLIIVCLSLIVFYALDYIVTNKKYYNSLICLYALSLLVFDISGLATHKVFYLYENQEDMKNIAESYNEVPCVYIYNNYENTYFIWNDVEQLLKFDKVLFADSNNNETINNDEIKNAESLIVFVSKMSENEDFSVYDELIKGCNKNVTSSKKLYDAMYATVYIYE